MAAWIKALPLGGALRYLGVSVVALGVDLVALLLLLQLGLGAALASALAYGLGVAAHWYLSAHLVFASGVARDVAGRRAQQGLFLASALVGLGLTVLAVSAAVAAGLAPALAKIIAVGISFIATYLLRACLVFRPRMAA